MSVRFFKAEFPDGTTELEAVIKCIQKGGRWKSKKTGEMVGEDLSLLYKRMRKIIWPELHNEDDGQRWHKICRDTILESRVTVLLGPGSSGKTHEAAWLSLCEYFCFPEETCVLVTSTDVRGLKMRVWGEISKLWNEAIEKFPFLPGYMIDSRIAITTDNIEEEGDENGRNVRDFRKGIVGVPTMQGGKFVGISKFLGIKQKRMRLVADEAQCFPVGTMVDTPSGPVPIENIKAGDHVFSAIGIDTVSDTFKRKIDSLVSIKTRCGKTIKCTNEHPFFTTKGWIKACDLVNGDYILSHAEAMRVLWGNFQYEREWESLPCLQGESNAMPVQILQKAIYKGTPQLNQGVLRNILRSEISSYTAGISSEFLQCGKKQKSWVGNKIEASAKAGTNGGISEAVYRKQPNEEHTTQEKDGGDFAFEWGNAKSSRWKRNRANQSGGIVALPSSRISVKSHCENAQKTRVRIPAALQTGFSLSEREASNRSGWKFPPSDSKATTGREEGCATKGAWVESVESEERSDFYGTRESCEVYNLHIQGHPSYSVNGLLVHNCMGSSFLAAFSNLNKNEDFRAIVLGNPNDMLDPLGKAAEPRDGWESYMNPEKTTVWDTRFMEGKCVNLIGLDSPNFDFPEYGEKGKFPYLISEKKIKDTLSFFPKDSFEYYGQCVGSMRIGTLARRVLTRTLCQKNGALERQVNWLGGGRTRIYAVDAAYGGDRCVGAWGEFGKSVEGKTILLLHDPTIIPIKPGEDMDAEYQIANFVKKECERLSIQPENFFYDATGRGSLGTALARIWSANTNPVESGGKPSDRPVSLDMFMNDPKTGARRLKLCSEHYSKRVTEFWFSVRYAVESGQLKGLNEEAMEEFCQRNWEIVKDGKYEIEIKADMKERFGKSPDLADATAILIEGARRRGFTIGRLANHEEKSRSDEWINNRFKQQHDLMRKKQLTYA